MDTSAMQYNYVVSRLGSFLIDYFIVSIIEVIIIFILFYDQIVQIVSGVNLLNIEYLIGLNGFYFSVSIIGALLSCFYYPISITLFGNTFGRNIFSLKMVRYDDQDLSFINVFFREIGKSLLLRLTFGLEAAFIFYKGENLTLHDRFFKTKIIPVTKN